MGGTSALHALGLFSRRATWIGIVAGTIRAVLRLNPSLWVRVTLVEGAQEVIHFLELHLRRRLLQNDESQVHLLLGLRASYNPALRVAIHGTIMIHPSSPPISGGLTFGVASCRTMQSSRRSWLLAQPGLTRGTSCARRQAWAIP